MFQLSNLYFAIEVLLGEMIFLAGCPRRKHFVLRFLLGVAGTLALAYLFPMPGSIRYNVFYSLLRFIVLFAYTVGGMAFCFDLKLTPLVSACVAGYAVQHIAYQITAIILHYTDFYVGTGSLRSTLGEVTFFPVIYLVIFLTFGLYARKNQFHKNTNKALLFLSAVILFVCVGLMRFARSSGEFNLGNHLYAITCSLLTLFIQFNLNRMFTLRNENEAIRLIREEEKKQYELSKSTIDLVNIKYHDLKRRLSAFERLTPEEISSLRETMRIYDSSFKTGNEVLDVILTENSLRSGEHGISITFMGDGAALGFMRVPDIYSLFGNALENAVEAVMPLTEPGKKTVSLVIEEKGDMVSVIVTNYFEGCRNFEDGLPVTTKTEDPGYHGYGMKSIRLIAEKYRGSLKAEADGDLFTLSVYLMK